ncbi:MAG: hypothetical protein EPN98_21555 [Phenylobacterium sp.]|uniref:hypothetical protein n=1 Tax=Phenylobacterium sp. TaxID=1871053 RepID=UPI0011FFCC00|nr:hypothetical protein [Phenylobacterium sp.]TAL29031.1 MAG: hypothetical protein EPN98_21555 [Phenylobacterium sp.]
MPRIFPLIIEGKIDLDAIKTIADLDARVAQVAAAARDAIFREIVKATAPPETAPAPVVTETK